MKVLDSNQYGAVPKSSTTIALLSMIHEWITGTDCNGSTVRAILFDYRKAFDLIDQTILIYKLGNMTSLEPLRNSQRDFSFRVTLKYIMLQSRGLRVNTRGVNEVVLI